MMGLPVIAGFDVTDLRRLRTICASCLVDRRSACAPLLLSAAFDMIILYLQSWDYTRL